MDLSRNNELFFRLTSTEKKEYTYSVSRNVFTECKNEYGYSLMKFYDTDISFFNNILDSLEKNNSIQNYLEAIKELDVIFTSFKKSFVRTIDLYSKKMILTSLIDNYNFLHRLVEIDFSSSDTMESRYSLAVKNMTESECDKYFNVGFQSKMIKVSSKLPVVCYSLHADLTVLVSVYLCDIIARGANIQKCKHCGRPFFPMGKAIYCDRVLYEKDKKEYTCKYLGAYTSYDQSLYIDDIKREYRKVYKRYFARTKIGTMTHPDFKAWSVNARKLMKLAEENKISYDEFLKKLVEY